MKYFQKLLAKFDFKSHTFQSLKLLDPLECQNLSFNTFDKLSQSIAIKFDLAMVKMEYREFAVDTDVASFQGNGDAVGFWNCVKSVTTVQGECKYQHLAALALNLLSIPSSNADCERVFSLVRRIKTDYRANLIPETISSLIGVHLNSPFQCCDQLEFPISLLDKAKSCTKEMNRCYCLNKEQMQ